MRALLLLCLLAFCATGCHIMRVRKIQLEASLVNDDNTLLSVEGRTNLPDGAVMETQLIDERGRRWCTGQGEVAHGKFFVVLDISRCPGFKTLHLDLYFDPMIAAAQVQRHTGPRGEALGGPHVAEMHDRQLVMRRIPVMLQMTHREAALRKLESGDGDVEELESYLARHPNDAEALIGLGLAYLKQRPSERHPGSKAETFITRGLALNPKSTRLGLEAKLWIERLEAEARRLALEKERLNQAKPSDAFRDETLVRPGEALGAFRLGMRMRFLTRHFTIDHTPAEGGTGVELFHVKEIPGLELSVDRTTGLLVSASSSSEEYHTQEGLRVGSLLGDVRHFIPEATVSYGEQKPGADGRLHAQGRLELDGLVLTMDRSVNPDFPLPLELVTRIEVVASTPTAPAQPSVDQPAPGATPQEEATP